MNPFLLLFKPLFIVGTWIVTGIVAVIMTLGGKFEGRPRTDGAPTLTAFFSPAAGNRPPKIEIELSDGERFRMILKDDVISALPVEEDTLAALGDSPRHSISTLVRLYSAAGRTKITLGVVLSAAQNATGTAIISAITVPSVAILMVSQIGRHSESI